MKEKYEILSLCNKSIFDEVLALQTAEETPLVDESELTAMKYFGLRAIKVKEDA